MILWFSWRMRMRPTKTCSTNLQRPCWLAAGRTWAREPTGGSFLFRSNNNNNNNNRTKHSSTTQHFRLIYKYTYTCVWIYMHMSLYMKIIYTDVINKRSGPIARQSTLGFLTCFFCSPSVFFLLWKKSLYWKCGPGGGREGVRDGLGWVWGASLCGNLHDMDEGFPWRMELERWGGEGRHHAARGLRHLAECPVSLRGGWGGGNDTDVSQGYKRNIHKSPAIVFISINQNLLWTISINSIAG